MGHRRPRALPRPRAHLLQGQQRGRPRVRHHGHGLLRKGPELGPRAQEDAGHRRLPLHRGQQVRPGKQANSQRR